MGTTERISISINEDSKRKLESLRRKSNVSTSECIRHLIELGYSLFRESDVDQETLTAWVEMLSKREHVILDTDYLKVIFSEIEKIKDERFWKEVRKVAASHAVEFLVRGLNSVEDVLKLMEKTNWFEVKKISEKTYSLILIDSSTKEFIKISLEVIFQKMRFPVKIEEGYGKLVIVDLSSNE
ncbi:CopG domain protein DNA-binding domain protein [Ferroglobus placidus DSM 10642]|uniref:CopG domain protein DNA-binding domain protein n=1 Tax=Ferroglobus placidus (strain DSM 10642 / AEDII12DO) TaxID=589924 RepID=D3S2P5_FERPA|nr:ribbon-helix-helix protein, CopG family [Ferroglobus placidus]ADC64575.1 CopG domain protein DNA-binding domain protein [Ferroglobus placidus DSM 10642]